ncbi:MAG TPA: type II secretion system protein GspC [Acidimicrobiia bacterium]|nr:type II secretion system protein GspC [Acidimicrobiia bacterium]
MPASRRLRLALELGLVLVVVTLAAYGVSAGLRAATSGDVSTATFEPHGSGDVRHALDPLDSYGVIAARDVFNPAAATDRRVAEGLRLWGVGLHGTSGHAVIEDLETHRQELYRVGDTIRGARVVSIAWDRVTLEQAGQEATLELAPPGEHRAGAPDDAHGPSDLPAASPNIRRTGADAFIVDRRELAGAVDNMSGLMTQLRAVAEVADGRPAGFRLFQIKEDSIFRRLGLQDGDVVQRVNGTALDDPTSLLTFLGRLRNEPRVAVDIVRGGSAHTLVYDLR